MYGEHGAHQMHQRDPHPDDGYGNNRGEPMAPSNGGARKRGGGAPYI